MDAERYRPLVSSLFPASRRSHRSYGVAIEQELVTADIATGAAVALDRLRAAVGGAGYAPYVTFEPGGQVELSFPAVAGPDALVRQVLVDLNALRADCASAGIQLHALPVDPRREAEVPLQLLSPRYVAMQRHFDTIGPAGRVMMRRTASTQVCLDWWSGHAGLEQWRVLNLAGPFVAAVFARCPGPGSRLATWLAVDPARTAFDDRLLQGEDPVAAYAAFAAGATPFVDGGAAHLTTLFPPVRPRGSYLEVRFPDVQEDDTIGRLVHVLVTLVHDDEVRAAALRMLAGEQSRLDQHWYDAAHGCGAVQARGWDLVAMTGSLALDGAA
jgi:glutamate--cysteine ligase